MGTYSSSISACAKGEQWMKSLELLGYMKCPDMQPDVVTRNTSIIACEKVEQRVRALEFSKYRRWPHVQTNSIVHNMPISAHVQRKACSHANRVIKRHGSAEIPAQRSALKFWDSISNTKQHWPHSGVIFIACHAEDGCTPQRVQIGFSVTPAVSLNWILSSTTQFPISIGKRLWPLHARHAK